VRHHRRVARRLAATLEAQGYAGVRVRLFRTQGLPGFVCAVTRGAAKRLHSYGRGARKVDALRSAFGGRGSDG
jgi:hypothetical protein